MRPRWAFNWCGEFVTPWLAVFWGKDYYRAADCHLEICLAPQWHRPPGEFVHVMSAGVAWNWPWSDRRFGPHFWFIENPPRPGEYAI